MQTLLLLGKTGQLGWELQRTLSPLGHIISLGREDIDLTNFVELRNKIRSIRPQIIINATAYNHVDEAESHKEFASSINHLVPLILAQEANRLSALMIHYSTDFVFDGQITKPHCERDEPNPINVYGWTKLQGEKAISSNAPFYFIFRTSWMYSWRRDNFLIKILRWAREQEILHVVNDQIGSPTWARMLAELTSLVLMQAGVRGMDWLAERSGIYHVAGSGAASRLEWAQAILAFDANREEQKCKRLEPAKTTDFPTPARRPAYSALNCEKFEQTFGLVIPFWKDSLQLAMDTNRFSG